MYVDKKTQTGGVISASSERKRLRRADFIQMDSAAEETAAISSSQLTQGETFGTTASH